MFIFFGFSQFFLGDLEGAGFFNPPPLKLHPEAPNYQGKPTFYTHASCIYILYSYMNALYYGDTNGLCIAIKQNRSKVVSTLCAVLVCAHSNIQINVIWLLCKFQNPQCYPSYLSLEMQKFHCLTMEAASFTLQMQIKFG